MAVCVLMRQSRQWGYLSSALSATVRIATV